MPLDAELYLALYTASRAMNSSYRPLLASLGLTHTQYLVMLVLWERRVVTVGELGDQLHLTSGTLSPLLARLEHAGLISRRRRLDDVRAVEVFATQKGLRLRCAADGVPAVIVRAAGLTSTEIAALRDALQVMTMRLSVADL
jgi:MarR family transcriptional regulator, organic hydroperoxide resistance regulator